MQDLTLMGRYNDAFVQIEMQMQDKNVRQWVASLFAETSLHDDLDMRGKSDCQANIHQVRKEYKFSALGSKLCQMKLGKLKSITLTLCHGVGMT